MNLSTISKPLLSNFQYANISDEFQYFLTKPCETHVPPPSKPRWRDSYNGLSVDGYPTKGNYNINNSYPQQKYLWLPLHTCSLGLVHFPTQ